jgi:GNAT superfamily N-acetyltransferase
MEIKIRAAEVGDSGAIARVQVDTWRSTYSDIVPSEFLQALSYEQRSAYWSDILSNEDREGIFTVAEDEDVGVVGFCVCGRDRSAESEFGSELFAIYILEAYQNQGVGRAMFGESISWARDHGMKSIIVWVLRDNPYRRFYESLGGELVAERMISIGDAQLPEVAYRWQIED